MADVDLFQGQRQVREVREEWVQRHLWKIFEIDLYDPEAT